MCLYFSEVIGGPVNDAYRFLQFHMHWGDDVHRGSEHLLDGMAFSAEVLYTDNFFTLHLFFFCSKSLKISNFIQLHFVNWNFTKYKDPESAIKSNKNDGLLVLAVFVRVSFGQNIFSFLVSLGLKE